MDDGVIRLDGLTKDFGPVRAVDSLTLTVVPGRVTGFLGPNGAGKTTTLRMLLGLVRPTSGTATVSGHRYDALPHPMRTVAASLEAASFHPGRSARDHLRTYAPLVAASDARCDEVLAQVGLGDAARRRVGGFSLGMRQRLALATALLGDARVLLLDEPSNGLDPEGIAWLRGFLRFLADEGRTVLVSSHILSEVQQTVDDVVVIARGRLVHQSSMAGLTDLARAEVRVESPDAAGLQALVAAQDWASRPVDDEGHAVLVTDTDAAAIGAAAFAAGLELHALAPIKGGLEEAFLRLVDGGEAR